MKKKKVLIILTILLILLLFSIFTKQIDGVDNYIYQLLNNLRCPFFDVFFLFFTTLLNVFVVCGICLLFMVLIKENRFLIPLNLMGIVILCHVLKYIFQRPRPEINLLNESGFSLPSAHACVSFAFFGFLTYLLWKKQKKKAYKNIIMIIGSMIILLIGISRIYFGVHYFSDVMAGFIVGAIYLILYVLFLKKYCCLKG